MANPGLEPGARTDEQLLRLVGAGDQSAFNDIYRRYVARCAGLIRRLIHHDREDALQETFIRLWTSAHTIKDAQALEGWLMTVVVRCAYRRDPQPPVTSDDTILWLVPAPECDPELREVLRMLDKRLRVLDGEADGHEQRIAWTLRYVEGQPLGFIAAALEISIATVKRRIARADQFIRRDTQVAAWIGWLPDQENDDE
jgi:RNA polymerase sigma-70 factor (ECF subfamily)